MKKLCVFLILTLTTLISFGQTYNMNNTDVTTCSGTFYDSGGSGADYGNSQSFTKTFTPSTAGNMLQFVFNSFSVETCCDDLTIYDGPTTSDPLIGVYTSNPGTITASNPTGELTFVWYSDGSITYAGWDATISCVAPPATIDMSNTSQTLCSGIFADDGGMSSDYTTADYTQTFTPSSAGMALQFVFTSWAIGDAQDWLKIYNGPSTGSPLIGTYDAASGSPGTITASNATGELTFEWYSDNNGLGAGWLANISCVTPPPSNDNCANAIALTVNPDYGCGTVTPGTIEDATQSPDAEGCSGTSDDDVWYSFVATNTAHRISLLNIAGSTTDMYHSIYSGTCGSLTELFCNDGNETNITGLTIGNTYYVRVYTYTSTGGQTSTFDVCVGTPPPPPANDDCLGAISLTVNPDYSCAVVTAGTTYSATNSGISACVGSGADDDVWFSFVATNTSHRISILNITGSSTDMVHEVFTGPCGSLTSIGCSDPNVTLWSGFTIGQTYWVRVYTYYTTGNANFNICIGTPPPPPSNDECAGAIACTVNPDELCGTVTAGYTTNATASAEANGCFGTDDDDVWFSFVATTTTHSVDLLNIVGTVTDMYHVVYEGPCGSLTQLVCNDGNSTDLGGLTPGQTYYIRVYTYTSTTGQTVDFEVCISTPPPPPMNDDPCGAINLPVGVGSPSYIGGYNNYTTASEIGQPGIPAPGCASYSGGDVWYQTIVPASGRIIFEMANAGGPTDMGMAIYTSSTNNCNNINTLIECDDDDSQDGAMPMICRAGAICTVPGDCQQNASAPPGTTVYVRVWELGNNSFGPFDITAYEPAAPGAASDCGNATVVSSLPFLENGQTTCCRGNTYNSGDGCGSLYQDGEDFIYEYTPSSDISIDISLTGTGSYTGVFVTDRCPSHPSANCIASQTETGGNPMLCSVNLTAGTTYYIMIDTDPGPTCTPFNIRIDEGIALVCGLNYSVSSTTYSWDDFFGTNIVLPVDDRFSAVTIPIPFTFCYDGMQFNQILVSSNGYIIFDPMGCTNNLPTTNAAPNTFSDWDINMPIPNTTEAPRNCIMAPWHDIDPAVGGIITYSGALGTAPNRRFVISWKNANMFSCTTIESTQQIKLFETTYDIEIHIDDKVLCSSWNEGSAIMGLHNYNGTQAVVPAGYNYPTQWTANNEAWKFTCGCVGCILLPVELLSFTGEAISENTNELKWTTASETNCDYFEIERMVSENKFTTIGKIIGAGNSSQAVDYKFLDKGFDYDVNYYRLKQVDFDGKYSYSETIVIGDNDNQALNNDFYPNPAHDKIFFEGNRNVDIFSVDGKLLLSENTQEINLTGFAKGVYIIKVNEKYSKLIIE